MDEPDTSHLLDAKMELHPEDSKWTASEIKSV